MTGIFPIDWLILTISLFNTGLLSWLGLTVLLTAQPRTPGAIAASVSLLVAAAFFVSHSAIVGQPLRPLHSTPGLELLWQASLYAVIALPVAWYGVVLWYAGFWSTPTSALRRRHTPLAILTGLLLILLIGLMSIGRALPTYFQAITLTMRSPDSFLELSLFGLTYPLYSLLSMGAALDALLRPGPVTRETATPARRRARPWLLSASVLLLLVSLVASFGLQRATQALNEVVDFASVAQTYLWLVGLDIIAAAMIGLIALLVGQALAEYEVFAGRSLPRRGLRRYWRRAVLLCAGISPPVAFALVRRSEPVYTVLLTLLILIAFYALVSWRSFIERERTVSLLRPLTTDALSWMRGPARLRRGGDHDRLDAPVLGIDAQALLTTLCRDSIGASRAVVLAQGPLAPLAGAPLQYPTSTTPVPNIDLLQLRATLDQAGQLGAMLEPADWHGLTWAVPLWSERGPLGVMLLGPKSDGGLFAQEDIEVARAGGERLLEALIHSELTNRLIAVQQRRLAEGQVLDQRLRRTLHDEILPRLHAAMLTMADGSVPSEGLQELAGVHHMLSDLVRALPSASVPELRRHGFFGALHQVVDAELRGAFDQVGWEVDAEAERAVGALPGFVSETLYYAAREALRNAARHGRGGELKRQLAVTLSATVAARDPASVQPNARALRLTICDDGVGVILGSSGPGPTSGTQHGLTLHTTLMAVAGGSLTFESRPAHGTRVDLHMPLADVAEALE